jgi:hypothetical protein
VGAGEVSARGGDGGRTRVAQGGAAEHDDVVGSPDWPARGRRGGPRGEPAPERGERGHDRDGAKHGPAVRATASAPRHATARHA